MHTTARLSRVTRAAAASIAALASTALQAEEGPPPPAHHVYATVEGEQLDIYLTSPPNRPDDEGPYPGVLLIHGGAWRSGSPLDWINAAARIAAAGYVVAAVEYRLVDGEHNTFPAAVHDVKAAVRWMRASAETLNIDPDRIAAVGASAGAHLAALLATSHGIEPLEGHIGDHDSHSSAVQAAVALAAPFDLVALAEVIPVEWQGTLAAFLGATYADDPDVYTLASPATHIDETDPPILLIHEIDEQVVFPRLQTTAFQTLLETVPGSRLIEYEGQEHAFWITSRSQTTGRANDVMIETIAFLDTALAPENETDQHEDPPTDPP